MHFADYLDLPQFAQPVQDSIRQAVIKPKYTAAHFVHARLIAVERRNDSFTSRKIIGFAHHGFSQVIRTAVISDTHVITRSEWALDRVQGVANAQPVRRAPRRVVVRRADNLRFTTGGILGGYRIFRKGRVIPRMCELTLFADDDMATVVGSRRIVLDAVGDFQASDGEVADFKLMLGQAQWVVAAMRATANAATQLSEPIEAIRDLPDALPENPAVDLRFKTLSRCSDYTIRCRGGSVTASSLVLVLRSAYFKRVLLDPLSADSQANAHFLNYSVDVVSPVISYLHTDTFGLEQTMPLSSVQEMLRLIDELEPTETRKLKNGISAYVHRRFEQNNTNVHDVALIAAIALQLPFERLAICALKLLANDHYIAFKEQYNDEAANPWRAEVYRTLATDWSSRKLHDAHDEKLLFPNEDGPFQPLVYIDRIRETGFTTRLVMGLD